MDKNLDPKRAFPAEVLALAEQGVPLPTWYAGPLYTGNGSADALKELEAERKRASAPDSASSDPDDDAPAAF